MLIALTGGIGSGKSTVAARWVALGAHEIDADVLARDVVAPGSEGLMEIAGRFGSDLILQDGTLNRKLLAERAFATAEKRKALEEILHPKIQMLAQQRVAGLSGVIVYTIPLFVETKSPLKFDKVVTVSCPVPIRLERLMRTRGMTEAEAKARISAQATDKERENKADYVIYSDCEMDELIKRSDAVYRKLTA